MSTELLAKHRIIDVDTHITEPPDVWTDRMSKSKWGDAIPHIERVDGVDAWFVGDERVGSPGPGSMAGFNGVVPSGPKTFDDIHPAMYDAAARLKLMDELGVDSQVLYSNVGGFGGQASPGAPNESGADNPLGQIFNDMLRGGTRATEEPREEAPEPEAPPEAEPRPKGSKGGLGDLFGEMFDTGVSMQRDYHKNMESIFDQFLEGMKR